MLYEANSGVVNVAATGFPVDAEATVTATAAGDRAVQQLRSDGLGGFVVNFHVAATQQLQVTVDASAGGAHARATLSYTGRNTAPDPLSPPSLSVSQRTISWKQVAGVGEYQLATKVRGRTPTYSVVPCCAVTPPEVAGDTSFGLRTDVPGSHWATEVALEPQVGSSFGSSDPSSATAPSGAPSAAAVERGTSLPRTSTASPSATSAPSVAAGPATEPGAFEVGIVGAGPSADAAQQARSLGAGVERIEFEYDRRHRSGGRRRGGCRSPAAAPGGLAQRVGPPDLTVVADWAAKYGPGGVVLGREV